MMRAARYKFEFKRMMNVIFENAWDGRWFKRAFLDDGSALIFLNSECSIDSISQSWSAITITNAITSDLYQIQMS